MIGREAEGERTFEGENSWKMGSSGQGGEVNKETAMVCSNRNSDRRGIKEMREERQESTMLVIT